MNKANQRDTHNTNINPFTDQHRLLLVSQLFSEEHWSFMKPKNNPGFSEVRICCSPRSEHIEEKGVLHNTIEEIQLLRIKLHFTGILWENCIPFQFGITEVIQIHKEMQK